MSFNASGVFNRLYNWVADAANGIDIKADRMDNEMNGFADGLSLCLTRDSRAAMIANLKMGGFAIVNLKDPVDDQDAATKKFIETLVTGFSNTTVSDTAPSTPTAGDLWYKTTDPAGLFVWVVGSTTSAWEPATEFTVTYATDAEAAEGTKTDVSMNPANTLSAYVSKTKDQTIAGIKTFSGDVAINGKTTLKETVAGGAVTTTAVDDGAKSSGTYTPSPVGGNMRRITNAGAFQIAPPSFAGDYTMIIAITNVTGAGAITASGFALKGDPFTTTVGHNFILSIAKINGLVVGIVSALQ